MSLTVAASAAYLTPVATPVNLMVMGPAGYRFGDYWRLGLPLLGRDVRRRRLPRARSSGRSDDARPRARSAVARPRGRRGLARPGHDRAWASSWSSSSRRIPVTLTAILVSLVFAAALAPTAIRLRARGLSRIVVGGDHVRRLVRRWSSSRPWSCSWCCIGDLRSVASAVQARASRRCATECRRLGPVRRPVLDQSSTTRSRRTARRPISPTIAGSIGNIVTVLVLGTFLTFFLLADGDRGWALVPALAASVAGRGGPVQRAARASTRSPGTSAGPPCWPRSTVVVVWHRARRSSASPSPAPSVRSRSWRGSCPTSGPSPAERSSGSRRWRSGGRSPRSRSLGALVASTILATRLLESTPMNSQRSTSTRCSSLDRAAGRRRAVRRARACSPCCRSRCSRARSRAVGRRGARHRPARPGARS